MRLTRVLVLGTFDLLHPGHVNFLREARYLGDELWVALNTDDFVERYKRPPIFTFEERRQMLKALRDVDIVFPNFGSEDSKPAIIHARKGTLEPMIIAHGDDWTGEDYMRQLDVTEEWLQARDIRIEYVPYTAGVSTTDIIRRIRPVPACSCGEVCIGQTALDEQAELLHMPERRCRRS